MPTRTACNYHETLQLHIGEFFAETGRETATSRDIALWMIQTGRWEAPGDMLLKKCQQDMSRALREEYIKDNRGRSIRAKHVARVVSEGRQLYLWADIRNAPRKHMKTAFQQRREQIVGDCSQLDRDVEFYNGLHPEQKPIQLTFDFRDDIEEGNFSGEYPPRNPR